jgi:AcrR family transcriptional regulator
MTTGRSQDTRNAILDACDRIMSRYGFLKMSMDDLAREAGVAKRTIYLHFGSKEDVGLSSIGRVVSSAQEKMTESLHANGTAESRLRAMLFDRVMTRVLAVQDYHLGLDDLFAVVRAAYMQRRREAFGLEVDLIADCLTEGREEGDFGFEDAAATARTLLLATNAFLPYSLSVADLGNPESIETQLLAMIDLLVRGLTSSSLTPNP